MDDLGFKLMEGARTSLRVLALCVMIGGVLALAAFCSACSSGPQLPVLTTPINIACNWHEGSCPRFVDGGLTGGTSDSSSSAAVHLSGCDCSVDRSQAGADAVTTGNNIRDNTISPEVNADVSAIPGTP